LNRETFAQHVGWREKLPAGFEVRHFAGERNKFAFRVMKGGESVSECSVVYYAKEACDSQMARVVEIGIETKKAYNGRALPFWPARLL